MVNAVPNPKRSGAFRAAASVFSARWHLELAVPHNLAAELDSEQMAEAHRNGTFPTAHWLQEVKPRALLDLNQLRKVLVHTGLVALALAIVAFAVGAGAGKVHPALQPDFGKVATWLGGTFAAWGALLQLSPVRQTFRGCMIHETVHSHAVRSFAIAGIVLSAIGALWW